MVSWVKKVGGAGGQKGAIFQQTAANFLQNLTEEICG